MASHNEGLFFVEIVEGFCRRAVNYTHVAIKVPGATRAQGHLIMPIRANMPSRRRYLLRNERQISSEVEFDIGREGLLAPTEKKQEKKCRPVADAMINTMKYVLSGEVMK